MEYDLYIHNIFNTLFFQFLFTLCSIIMTILCDLHPIFINIDHIINTSYVFVFGLMIINICVIFYMILDTRSLLQLRYFTIMNAFFLCSIISSLNDNILKVIIIVILCIAMSIFYYVSSIKSKYTNLGNNILGILMGLSLINYFTNTIMKNTFLNELYLYAVVMIIFCYTVLDIKHFFHEEKDYVMIAMIIYINIIHITMFFIIKLKK